MCSLCFLKINSMPKWQLLLQTIKTLPLCCSYSLISRTSLPNSYPSFTPSLAQGWILSTCHRCSPPRQDSLATLPNAIPSPWPYPKSYFYFSERFTEFPRRKCPKNTEFYFLSEIPRNTTLALNAFLLLNIKLYLYCSKRKKKNIKVKWKKYVSLTSIRILNS